MALIIKLQIHTCILQVTNSCSRETPKLSNYRGTFNNQKKKKVRLTAHLGTQSSRCWCTLGSQEHPGAVEAGWRAANGWFFLDASYLIDSGVHWENCSLLQVEGKQSYQERKSQRTTRRPENHAPEKDYKQKHTTADEHCRPQGGKVKQANQVISSTGN